MKATSGVMKQPKSYGQGSRFQPYNTKRNPNFKANLAAAAAAAGWTKRPFLGKNKTAQPQFNR